MNNINLNSRDQALALAMKPNPSTFSFFEEDFDEELTMNQMNDVSGAWGAAFGRLLAGVCGKLLQPVITGAIKSKTRGKFITLSDRIGLS